MYESLKSLIKKTLPRNFFLKNETRFRYLYARLFLSGSDKKCNICQKSFSRFIKLQNKEKLCPYCGSLPRNRRLYNLLEEEFLRPGISILHFSPSRSLYRLFKKRRDLHYTSSDFAGEFFADEKFDITNIKCPDNKFDLIICYHILEHIQEDQKAMVELNRILKPNGVCIIQTPFKGGEIYEDPTIQSMEDRLKHFGQEDHVRVYSVAGLCERLENVGFSTEVREYDQDKANSLELKGYEQIIIAKKV